MSDGILTIRLWEPWTECCICNEATLLTHAVGYCCGPTHDEIGTESREYPGHIVGGMPACKPCHDQFYDMPRPAGWGEGGKGDE